MPGSIYLLRERKVMVEGRKSRQRREGGREGGWVDTWKGGKEGGSEEREGGQECGREGAWPRGRVSGKDRKEIVQSTTEVPVYRVAPSLTSSSCLFYLRMLELLCAGTMDQVREPEKRSSGKTVRQNRINGLNFLSLGKHKLKEIPPSFSPSPLLPYLPSSSISDELHCTNSIICAGSPREAIA